MTTPRRFLPIVLAVAGCLLGGGCDTAPRQVRISQAMPDFTRLPTGEQRRIKRGAIAPGDTPQMIYVALGSPHRVTVSADGSDTTWSYQDIYPTEAMHPEALYRTPSTKGLGSHAAQAWGGGFAGPGDARPRSAEMGSIAPEVPRVDVDVRFHDGRVVSFAVRPAGS